MHHLLMYPPPLNPAVVFHLIIQLQIKLLEEWRAGAESSLAELQAEQHGLKADRDEALAAAKQTQEQLAQAQSQAAKSVPPSSDADVEQLRAQIAQLQSQLQSGKEDAAATITTSKGAALPASSVEVTTLKGQLSTAAAVVFVTRRALSSCLRVVSSAEPPLVAEDVDIDVALMALKVCSFFCCCASPLPLVFRRGKFAS